ncbi:type II secretion system protein N [Pseudidiomarina sp. WS423]|uniref:type II secretion system protein N n=1 Tax=Pseudidiomarina sp. WS423 TaxID=3425124 RepID=UPI003D6FC918
MKLFKLWWWLLPLYLIILLATAPARWLSLANDVLPAGTHITPLQGTLWRGTMNLQAQLPTGASLNLEQVEWQLSPLALLLGKLDLQLSIPAGNVFEGQVQLVAASADEELAAPATEQGPEVGLQVLQLSGELAGNVQAAVNQLRLPVPLTVAGEWQLQLDDYSNRNLTSGRFCDSMQGTLDWTSSEIRLNQAWHALGDYRLHLGCTANQAISATIKDNNWLGLIVEAKVQGSMGRPQLSVAGSIKPTTQAPQPVAEMVSFIGQPDSQGRIPFNW